MLAQLLRTAQKRAHQRRSAESFPRNTVMAQAIFPFQCAALQGSQQLMQTVGHTAQALCVAESRGRIDQRHPEQEHQH